MKTTWMEEEAVVRLSAIALEIDRIRKLFRAYDWNGDAVPPEAHAELAGIEFRLASILRVKLVTH